MHTIKINAEVSKRNENFTNFYLPIEPKYKTLNTGQTTKNEIIVQKQRPGPSIHMRIVSHSPVCISFCNQLCDANSIGYLCFAIVHGSTICIRFDIGRLYVDLPSCKSHGCALKAKTKHIET